MAKPSHFLDGCWPDVEEFLPTHVTDRIAELAVDADRAGAIDPRSLEALRSVGWPRLAIPEPFGGNGLGLLASCALQVRLAESDGALAVAMNMHLFSIGLMAEHWRRGTDSSWLLMEAIATQNRFLASAFAEPNLGGSTTRSLMRAEEVDGGWRVSGTKRPCSLAKEADLVCLQLETAGEPADLLVALLPTSAPGIEVIEDWDAMGMRGSGSNTLVLSDCFIPKELVFYRARAGAQNDDLFAVGTIWFALTTTACYLGLARVAVAEASELLQRLRVAHLDSNRASLPTYQALIGGPIASLLNLQASCANVASRLDDGAPPQELLDWALAVKHQAMCEIPHILETLAEACGGVSLSRKGSFERLWRDAQAIRFHPPTAPPLRQHLARRALGLPGGLDLMETKVSDQTSEHPTSGV